MDVGEPNFRFQLDDPEKKSRAIRQPMSAEIHVSSLDRFNSSPGKSQTLNQLLATTTNDPANYNYSSTKCIIQTQRNLLYGYFNRLAITEMQIFLRIPTIITGVNDILTLTFNPGGIGTPVTYDFTIPQGYYTPLMLAAQMQAQIRAASTNLTTAASFTVTPPANQGASITSGRLVTGFQFATGTTDTVVFPIPAASATQLQRLRMDRLLGTNAQSFIGFGGAVPDTTVQTYSPNWFPTDYIDIVSKSLTNYKETKDTNSSESAPQGVIGRIYLSDMAMNTTNTTGYSDPNVIGSSPVTFTKKWAIPNWSQWSPNQAITNIDITLLDMWGNVVYWSNDKSGANTEWEMTIVASE